MVFDFLGLKIKFLGGWSNFSGLSTNFVGAKGCVDIKIWRGPNKQSLRQLNLWSRLKCVTNQYCIFTVSHRDNTIFVLLRMKQMLTRTKKT